ncbi:uncharacterized protein DMAD_06372 [Drosophila madeirensis]|uniref:Uncharacterized protein n=1 Tax=Drosophila madeirensis TaxID=30013 RepID=A0AAU9FQ79_DROMD
MSIADRVKGRMCQTDSMYHFQPSTWLASEQLCIFRTLILCCEPMYANVGTGEVYSAVGKFNWHVDLGEAHYANVCTTIRPCPVGRHPGNLRQSDDSPDEGVDERIDDTQQAENLANEEAASRGL